MAATIKDIASKTGLGLATISKYLNGGNVLPENKIAIERAIKALHYTVNETARSLKTKRSKTIGVVLPEVDNIFFMRIITEMEDLLRKENYAVILNDCHTNKKLEIESVDFLLSKNVDGIINFPVSSSGNHLKAALEQNVPVLLIDRLTPKLRSRVDSISIDNVAIAREATALLVKNGHKNIGMIAGPRYTYTADERLRGYCEVLEENGIAVNQDYIMRCEYSVEGGFTGFKELMHKNSNLTAVFVTNHDMTLGALMAIKEDHYNVPDDLSFVGFDNMDWAKIVVPKLTIVEQPIADMGRMAAEIMLKRLAADTCDMPRQSILLSARLNMGDSIKKI